MEGRLVMGLKNWLSENLQRDPQEPADKMEGRNVTVRMTREDVMHLEGLAVRFGKTRTRVAEEILQAALRDAWELLKDPDEWREDEHDRWGN
jgi:hypothetical protein